MARQSVRHLARDMTAFIHMEDDLREKIIPRVQVEGAEHVAAALAKGKGLIAFNAHYGCWEMSSAATMKSYPKVAGIYRPLNNIVAVGVELGEIDGGVGVDELHGLFWGSEPESEFRRS